MLSSRRFRPRKKQLSRCRRYRVRPVAELWRGRGRHARGYRARLPSAGQHDSGTGQDRDAHTAQEEGQLAAARQGMAGYNWITCSIEVGLNICGRQRLMTLNKIKQYIHDPWYDRWYTKFSCIVALVLPLTDVSRLYRLFQDILFNVMLRHERGCSLLGCSEKRTSTSLLSTSCIIFRPAMDFVLQGVERFFESVMQAILRHVNFDGKPSAGCSRFFNRVTCRAGASVMSPRAIY